MRALLGSILFILASFAASVVAQGPPAPATGSVEGVVLDERGQPIAGAGVWCVPGAMPPIQPATTSDAQGRFLLEGVAPVREVFVSAYKESDGYPLHLARFFKTSDRETRKVAVESGKTTGGVMIQLTRAAFLNLEITDRGGAPINAVGLDFTRDDDPKYGHFGTSASAPYSMLVPPVPFRFTVQATGYWLWRSEVIAPKSGETVGVKVRLQRN